MNDVNLLPDVQVSSMAEIRMRRNVLVLVAGVSIVWLVFFGGLFGFNQLSVDRLKALESKKIADQEKIAGWAGLGTKLITLKQKLAGIKFIEEGRYDFPESLKYVLSVLPANVSPTKISVADDGEATLNLTSTESEAVAEFVSQMGQESTLKSTKLVNLRLSDDGKYAFVISAQYGKGTKFTVHN